MTCKLMDFLNKTGLIARFYAACLSMLFAVNAADVPAHADPSTRARLAALPKFLAGGDISMLRWEEQNGQVYMTLFDESGNALPALSILGASTRKLPAQ